MKGSVKRLFKIVTLGCKVNQYESASISTSLMQRGWEPAGKGRACHLGIINTCIVTQKASHQSRQAISKMIRENPGARIIVTGCYAQVYPDELARMNNVDLVLGNTEKPMILAHIDNISASGPCEVRVRKFEKKEKFGFLPAGHFRGRARAYLKIQDGCELFCSYCIVPFARGPYRSMEPDLVMKCLMDLAEMGYREIVLTGIHLGRYGTDLGCGINLNSLLLLIDKQGAPARIRLSSLEPVEIGHELIEMVGQLDWLCRHFHIPLQSGDKEILNKMGRRYTPEDFERLVVEIREKIPVAGIGVDVMVGFPGEGDKAYANTYSLIKRLPISYLHVFPYSQRKGTLAYRLPGHVSPEVIKQRAARLRALGQEKKKVFYESCQGQVFNVLAERWRSLEDGTMLGTSDNYLKVEFASEHINVGHIYPVKMKKVADSWITGEMG